MDEAGVGIGWFAVILGAVLSFLLGWLWYSPKLFGTKWAEGVGVELNTADKMPIAAMVTQFVGLLLMSWFVGLTIAYGLLTAAILGTAAFTLLAVSGGMFTRKSSYARNAEAGYWIACLAVMVICQAIF